MPQLIEVIPKQVCPPALNRKAIRAGASLLITITFYLFSFFPNPKSNKLLINR